MNRIEEDWTPSEKTKKILEDECPGVDIDYETRQFRDWFIASGRVYRDWQARFRGWVRKNHREYTQKSQGHKATSASDVSDRRSRLIRIAKEGDSGINDRISRFPIRKRDR